METVSPYSENFVEIVDEFIKSHPISLWDNSYKIPTPLPIPYEWFLYWAFCTRERCKISLWQENTMTIEVENSHDNLVLTYESYSRCGEGHKFKRIYNWDKILPKTMDVILIISYQYNLLKFTANYEQSAKISYKDRFSMSDYFLDNIRESKIITEYCQSICGEDVCANIFPYIKLSSLHPTSVIILCYLNKNTFDKDKLNNKIICNTIDFIHSSVIFIHGISNFNDSCIEIYATLAFSEIFYADNGNGYYLSKLNNIQHYSSAELNEWTSKWKIGRKGNVYNNLKIKLSQRVWDGNKDYIFDEKVNGLKTEKLLYVDVV